MKHSCNLSSCADVACPARAAECHVSCTTAPNPAYYFAPGAVEGPPRGRFTLSGEAAEELKKIALVFVCVGAIGAWVACFAGIFSEWGAR